MPRLWCRTLYIWYKIVRCIRLLMNLCPLKITPAHGGFASCLPGVNLSDTQLSRCTLWCWGWDTESSEYKLEESVLSKWSRAPLGLWGAAPGKWTIGCWLLCDLPIKTQYTSQFTQQKHRSQQQKQAQNFQHKFKQAKKGSKYQKVQAHVWHRAEICSA